MMPPSTPPMAPLYVNLLQNRDSRITGPKEEPNPAHAFSTRFMMACAPEPLLDAMKNAITATITTMTVSYTHLADGLQDTMVVQPDTVVMDKAPQTDAFTENDFDHYGEAEAQNYINQQHAQPVSYTHLSIRRRRRNRRKHRSQKQNR